MRVAKKYNDEDFAPLGWHDCRVYRISIPDEDSYLGLDIDYIFNFEKEDPLSDSDSMIWIRYWYDTINPTWLGGKIIVHGHTPTKQLVIKHSLKELAEIPAINIDAGCVFQGFGLGHLCALNLDTKTLIFQARIDVIA